MGNIVGFAVGALVGAFVGKSVVGALEVGIGVGMLDDGAPVGACDGQSLVLDWMFALVDIHGAICPRFGQFEIWTCAPHQQM